MIAREKGKERTWESEGHERERDMTWEGRRKGGRGHGRVRDMIWEEGKEGGGGRAGEKERGRGHE